MTLNQMDLRRQLVRLTNPNDSTDVLGPFDLINFSVKKFSRGRGIPFQVDAIDGGARVTRLAEKPRGLHGYPEIEALEPGQSVLLNVPPISHQRVRVTASQTSNKNGHTYRCTREGDAIRVTRTDGMDIDACMKMPLRSTKYNLDRLATERQIVFKLDPPDQSRLRSACSFKSKQTGWTIRCRLQDDGSMLVYRTDAGAPSAA